ncbi:uncharacterized protein LOC111861694 [Cryptotermes secundus]|uniref:uncharacterized protein LOC111861694 n=1 Tax=Cryptotermes secundus TaxID=105785 RepID=UPI000CD7BCE5|nr:uncharacterized protein LOC111861694 [Cryptotermes secundus]
MDPSLGEVLLLAVALDEDEGESRRKRRITWVHDINLSREELGEFYTLIPQLLKDEKRFYIYFRMKIERFDEILRAIGQEDIIKQYTNCRRPILAIKWRIFLRPIELKGGNIKHIVSAACLLHNFLSLKNCDEKYREELLRVEPLEGEMFPIQPLRLPMAANVSYAIRERFVAYFNLMTAPGIRVSERNWCIAYTKNAHSYCILNPI